MLLKFSTKDWVALDLQTKLCFLIVLVWKDGLTKSEGKRAYLDFAARIDVDREETEKLFAIYAINIIWDFAVDHHQAEEAELLVEIRPELDFVAVELEYKLVFVELVYQRVAVSACKRVS